MISCQHARQLFDRYLDDELSPSLQTEVHAHRLNCTACQNELAMLEACGDVVRLDRSEPLLSASFTDRVLLARRSQRVVRPRRWGRLIATVAAPLAAAASLALTVSVIMPPARERPTLVAGVAEAAREDVRRILVDEASLPADAKRELESTPQMEAVDGWMAVLLEHSKSTLEGTRRSAEQIQALLKVGLLDTNEKLLAKWREQNEIPASLKSPNRSGSSLEPFDPAFLNDSPVSPEPLIESALEDAPAAL
ncbi:MAG: hypothetical protein AMXMBFR13_18790 [Phycisphaerae bacterium]